MKNKAFAFLIVILTFCALVLAVGCGGEVLPESDSEELLKLPADFPLKYCPLYGAVEVVGVIDKGSTNYMSYEVTFNSSAEYEKIIAYYSKLFPSSKTKDFGIAYSLLSVPSSGSGYMCSFSIYSDKTKGERGVCTVIVTVSDY